MKTNVKLKLAVSIGKANPIPLNAPEVINVFTPIRLLELSRSGPPLLPRLMEASICITP